MKIAFTICSNNYFAQAKVLAISLLSKNPEYHFIIGLVDKKSDQVNYLFHPQVEIIEIDVLDLDKTYGIYDKYDIIELNTCVKPAYFEKIKFIYPAASLIIYFDPDIVIFTELGLIEEEAKKAVILLTPHVFTPIPLDNLEPGENDFLNYGIYNLGFIAISFHDEEVYKFLDWWKERTMNLGYKNPQRGLFVDQLWINLVPLYFKKVTILQHRGMNMAPWNLHERSILKQPNGCYSLHSGEPLIFYHFSTYDFKKPNTVSRFYSRYTFEGRPILKELYRWYHIQLEQNDIENISAIECFYMKEPRYRPSKNGMLLRKIARKVLPPLFFDIRTAIIKKSS